VRAYYGELLRSFVIYKQGNLINNISCSPAVLKFGIGRSTIGMYQWALSGSVAMRAVAVEMVRVA